MQNKGKNLLIFIQSSASATNFWEVFKPDTKKYSTPCFHQVIMKFEYFSCKPEGGGIQALISIVYGSFYPGYCFVDE